MHVAISKNGVPIRLPLERWFHIEEGHNELAGKYSDVQEAVADPDVVLKGSTGERIAVRKVAEGKWLVVIYRERAAEDGFVITAFLTKRLKPLMKRGVLWQREQ